MVSIRHTPDSRNRLNDLSAKEWLQLSRSWWSQTGLGKSHPGTAIERQHPAPFSYRDIQKLIALFTKPGMTVLDPFCGVASTLKAAALSGRNAIGIEISPRWVRLGKTRLRKEVPVAMRNRVKLKMIQGDCLSRLPAIRKGTVDFIVTSPPYWNILNKNPDHKVQSERLDKGLATRYSSSKSDLGNLRDYGVFMKKLQQVFKECHRVLAMQRYMVVIVGDFRHQSEFYPFHMHVVDMCRISGFALRGILVLVQNSKRLYPYGIPYAYVQNIHHQYALILQRD